MNFGQGSLGITGLQEPSGPPFDTDSADNGLSVDAGSGHIVLGNDLDDAAAPAELLSDRQIDMPDDTFIRLKKFGIPTQTGDETIELGGGAGASYEWRGSNPSVFDRQRLPIRLFMPRSGSGTITGIAIGNSSSVDVELSHINSETFLPKGGVLRVRNNSGVADMSNLSLECLNVTGNIFFRGGSPTAAGLRFYPSGNLLVAAGADGIGDGNIKLRIRALAAQNPLLVEDSAGTQLMQQFANGNLRVGAGVDMTGRLQVRGGAGVPIFRTETSAGGNAVGGNANGELTLGVVNPRSAASVVLVRQANAVVTGITGASGGPFGTITSITVVDGVITAITGV